MTDRSLRVLRCAVSLLAIFIVVGLNLIPRSVDYLEPNFFNSTLHPITLENAVESQKNIQFWNEQNPLEHGQIPADYCCRCDSRFGWPFPFSLRSTCVKPTPSGWNPESSPPSTLFFVAPGSEDGYDNFLYDILIWLLLLAFMTLVVRRLGTPGATSLPIKRSIFHIHLGTAMLLMLLSSAFLFANVRRQGMSSDPSAFDSYGWPFEARISTHHWTEQLNHGSTIDQSMLAACPDVEATTYFPSRIVLNVLTALFILILVGILSEWRIRRRRRGAASRERPGVRGQGSE